MKVKIKITATVTATVELDKNETIENIKERYVDIYLHGYGEKGHIDKIDLGSDSVNIEILDE